MEFRLQKEGIKVVKLNGGMTVAARDHVLTAFKVQAAAAVVAIVVQLLLVVVVFCQQTPHPPGIRVWLSNGGMTVAARDHVLTAFKVLIMISSRSSSSRSRRSSSSSTKLYEY